MSQLDPIIFGLFLSHVGLLAMNNAGPEPLIVQLRKFGVFVQRVKLFRNKNTLNVSYIPDLGCILPNKAMFSNFISRRFFPSKALMLPVSLEAHNTIATLHP